MVFLLSQSFVLVFFSCLVSLGGHGRIQSLVFQSHRTSHLGTYSITILVISTYHSSDFTASQYTFLFAGARFISPVLN